MKVSLVGAGPGDPGLFTLRGMELLREADVVVYDALINPDLLKYAGKNAELIYVGKVAGKHSLPQEEINSLLLQCAREKGKVVRLKGGDPYIFGRGGEEAEYLAKAGIPFEEVPGISSAIAAPAYAGIPLSHRDFCSAITIVTGHENPEKNASALDWDALARSKATLVFVMGMKNLPFIAAKLISAGMAPDTPAAVIYRGTTPMQRSLCAPLAELPSAAAAANFTNPSVIVVGRVVSLHENLDWIKNRKLLGRRILVTRAREQASELADMLAKEGAEALEFPSLAVHALSDYSRVDAAIEGLDGYDWLIFTSVNGVRFFWERLDKAGRDSRALANIKVAAIGPATGLALEKKGVKPDLIPSSYVAEQVAEAILQMEGGSMTGKRALLPRAAYARMALPDTLARAGAQVDVIPVYEAKPVEANAEQIIGLIAAGELDCISFASSSTVRNFLSIIPPDLLKGKKAPALASIGPITSKTLQEHGLKAAIEPEQYTIPALVQAIEKYFAQTGED